MKFIDKIKKLNILSSDNKIEVEDILLKSKSRVLQLSLLLDNAISYEAYQALYRAIKEIVSPLDLKLEYRLGYKNDLLSTDEYKTYLEVILKKLVLQSARYKILSIDDCKIEEKNINFLVPQDALGVDAYSSVIVKEFESYGLSVNVSIHLDESKSIQAQIEKLEREKEEELRRQQQEAYQAQRINKEMENQKKYGRKGFLP
jgi:DNA polymerase III alpha subunit (gram-positive type)